MTAKKKEPTAEDLDGWPLDWDWPGTKSPDEPQYITVTEQGPGGAANVSSA
jgi:hypothetical protein